MFFSPLTCVSFTFGSPLLLPSPCLPNALPPPHPCLLPTLISPFTPASRYPHLPIHPCLSLPSSPHPLIFFFVSLAPPPIHSSYLSLSATASHLLLPPRCYYLLIDSCICQPHILIHPTPPYSHSHTLHRNSNMNTHSRFHSHSVVLEFSDVGASLKWKTSRRRVTFSIHGGKAG